MTPPRVTSGGAHLCSLTPGQLSSEETLQQWQAIGDTVSDLIGPGLESQTSCIRSVRFATELTGRSIKSGEDPESFGGWR